MKEELNGHQKFISKPEIQFWVPIVIYAITLTSAYFSLSNQIALLTQRVESSAATTAEYAARNRELTKGLNNFSERLIRLESKQIIK